MADISAVIELRPTRIGFLVRPTDLASVRAIMRACACLWGGLYNPIIPVFQRPPKEWKSPIDRLFQGPEIAKGYVRFFEPDVYVEAEKGLLEKAGLGALREEHWARPQVITLKQLFEPGHGLTWSEPEFGLSINDALVHIYETEQRFVQRDKLESLLVEAASGNALTEAIFGFYPTSPDVKYIEEAYIGVYQPEKVGANPHTWRRVFMEHAQTPLRVTRHGLDARRRWHHDALVFVFDPARVTDLIDLWNLRLEPLPVLPVPVGWFEALADDIHNILKSAHRPVIGNPNGVMHNATIEFGRSIRRTDAEALIGKLKPGLPPGALMVKFWRNSIWIDHRDDNVRRDTRMKVVARERRANLTIDENRGKLRTAFEALAPEFSDQHGKGGHRWINVVRISSHGDRSVAKVLPFNTFDRGWPRLALGHESTPIGSEGWVFPQHHKDLAQDLSLLTPDEAIVGSLARRGITARLSEPGHIAKQMLEQLEGLWGVYLLADLGTITLLNKMAGGLRRRRNEEETIEENFELRTATLKEWTDLVSRLREQGHSAISLGDFTKRNIIRAGLETKCPHCSARNWSTLTAVDYRVTCERCLKPYDFPQASLLKHNANWTYRVVGPFSVPDYGRGSYGALLALRMLQLFRSSMDPMTFATAMSLSFDGIQREVDFIALCGEEHVLEPRRPPQLVIGETKSQGDGELITATDLAKLKKIAGKLPDAVVVIGVLRDDFTAAERKILARFVAWGRRVNAYGEPTNPVVLRTSRELTMDYHLQSTWKALGGAHAKFADYQHTRNLFSLADATQQIYLGMRSFHQERDEYRRKRRERLKKLRPEAAE